jgi:hypothetical protein
MPGAIGISLRAVRTWHANRLQPPRHPDVQAVERPEAGGQVEDIVGLYINPPRLSVVLSIDAESRIQDFDRTRPAAETRQMPDHEA